MQYTTLKYAKRIAMMPLSLFSFFWACVALFFYPHQVGAHSKMMINTMILLITQIINMT